MSFFLKNLPDKLVWQGRLKMLTSNEITTLRITGDHINPFITYSEMSQQALAVEINASPRTVRRVIQKLKRRGYLSVREISKCNASGKSRVHYFLHYWKGEDLVDKQGEKLKGVQPWMFKHVYVPPQGSERLTQSTTGRSDLWLATLRLEAQKEWPELPDKKANASSLIYKVQSDLGHLQTY